MTEEQIRGTKNLGLIQAIHAGTSPPLNTKIIWYDDNLGQKIHKYYKVEISQWVPLNTIIDNYPTMTTSVKIDESELNLSSNYDEIELIQKLQLFLSTLPIIKTINTSNYHCIYIIILQINNKTRKFLQVDVLEVLEIDSMPEIISTDANSVVEVLNANFNTTNNTPLPTIVGDDIQDTAHLICNNGSAYFNWNGTAWVFVSFIAKFDAPLKITSLPPNPIIVTSTAYVIVDSIVIPANTFKSGDIIDFTFVFHTHPVTGAQISAGFNTTSFVGTNGILMGDVSLGMNSMNITKRRVIFHDNTVYYVSGNYVSDSIQASGSIITNFTSHWLNLTIQNTLNVALKSNTETRDQKYLYTIIEKIN